MLVYRFITLHNASNLRIFLVNHIMLYKYLIKIKTGLLKYSFKIGKVSISWKTNSHDNTPLLSVHFHIAYGFAYQHSYLRILTQINHKASCFYHPQNYLIIASYKTCKWNDDCNDVRCVDNTKGSRFCSPMLLFDH